MSYDFPYCRLYCDVKRLINDPLENEGLGISYSRWVLDKNEHRVLRSFSGKSEAFALYTDFHSEVSKKIVGMLGSILLIDCHSFSALSNLLNSNPPDIESILGTMMTRPALTKLLLATSSNTSSQRDTT